MKVSIQALKQKVSNATKAVQSRTTMPILTHLKLSVKDGMLTIVGCDLEKFIVEKLQIKNGDEWECCVPARLLSDLLGSMPNEVIELSVLDDELILTLGEDETNLRTADTLEYPLVPEIPQVKPIELDALVLKTSILKTVYATIQDESRPVLKGLFVTSDGSTISFAAADGVRLACIDVQTTGEPFSFLIPGAFMSELARILPDNGNVNIYATDSQAFFELTDTLLISQLIEGQFVNYKVILPTENKIVVKINAAKLNSAAKQCNVIARSESNVIHFEFDNDVVTLSATSSEMGNTSLTIDAKIEGEYIDTAVNGSFLIDALATMKGNVEIEHNGPHTPVVFRQDEHINVLMPVQIRS